jgi:Ca2+-binding EF-hand superfamily protein
MNLPQLDRPRSRATQIAASFVTSFAVTCTPPVVLMLIGVLVGVLVGSGCRHRVDELQQTAGPAAARETPPDENQEAAEHSSSTGSPHSVVPSDSTAEKPIADESISKDLAMSKDLAISKDLAVSKSNADSAGMGNSPSGRVPAAVGSHATAVPRVLLLTPHGPWLLEFQIRVAGKTQLEQLQQAAQQLLPGFDTNQDGVITWDELTLSERFRTGELGGEQPRSEDDRLVYIQARDRNRNKRVDVDEVAGLFAQGNISLQPFSLIGVREDSQQLRITSSLFRLLDVDEDGRLTASDWQQAPGRLASRDANEDEVLDPAEIRRTVTGREMMSRPEGTGADLAWLIDANTDWNALLRTLREKYAQGQPLAPQHLDQVPQLFRYLDENQNERLSVTELPRLRTAAAAGSWQVELGLEEKEQERRLHFTGRLSEPAKAALVTSSAGYWELLQPGLRTTWQTRETIGGDEAKDLAAPLQLRVMAAEDLLWEALDQDQDGRLSAIEMRLADQHLAALDADHSGDITDADLPLVWHCILQRGVVDESMSAAFIARRPASRRNSAADAQTSSEVPAELPPWFVRMDLDGDGQLSRREWLGSIPQFKALDKNQDDYLNWSEVQPTPQK